MIRTHTQSGLAHENANALRYVLVLYILFIHSIESINGSYVLNSIGMNLKESLPPMTRVGSVETGTPIPASSVQSGPILPTITCVASIVNATYNTYDDNIENTYGGAAALAVAPIEDNANNKHDDNNNNRYGGAVALAVTPMEDDANNKHDDNNNNRYGGAVALAVTPMDDNANNKHDDNNNNRYGGAVALAVIPMEDNATNKHDDNNNNKYGGAVALAVTPMEDNANNKHDDDDNNRYGGAVALAVTPMEDNATNKHDGNNNNRYGEQSANNRGGMFVCYVLVTNGVAYIAPVTPARMDNIDARRGTILHAVAASSNSSVAAIQQARIDNNSNDRRGASFAVAHMCVYAHIDNINDRRGALLNGDHTMATIPHLYGNNNDRGDAHNALSTQATAATVPRTYFYDNDNGRGGKIYQAMEGLLKDEPASKAGTDSSSKDKELKHRNHTLVYSTFGNPDYIAPGALSEATAASSIQDPHFAMMMHIFFTVF